MKTKNRTKYVKVHGWRGEGATASEAKANALERIEAAADWSFTPAVIRWRGMTAFVYRDGSQWGYTIVHPDEPNGVREHASFATSFPNRNECIRAAARHLAQSGYEHSDDWRAVPSIVSREDRRDIRRWQQWQSICAEARGKGMDSQTSWQFACDHQHDRENAEALDIANEADVTCDH